MRYEILKDFKGSQNGSVTEEFKAGTVRELSPYLAGCIPDDWARAAKVEIDNKAIVTTGEHPAAHRSRSKAKQ